MNSIRAASTSAVSIASISWSDASGRWAARAGTGVSEAERCTSPAPSLPARPGDRSPIQARSSDLRSRGRAVLRSARKGDSLRTRRISSKSTEIVARASENSGARSIRVPSGAQADDPPGKSFPPSEPASCETITKTPCSLAARAAIRSHSSRLAGRGVDLVNPRAGDAQPLRISSAPSRARTDAVIECHRSSQISIPIRPNLVSNARTSLPGSMKRPSSNSP